MEVGGVGSVLLGEVIPEEARGITEVRQGPAGVAEVTIDLAEVERVGHVGVEIEKGLVLHHSCCSFDRPPSPAHPLVVHDVVVFDVVEHLMKNCGAVSRLGETALARSVESDPVVRRRASIQAVVDMRFLRRGRIVRGLKTVQNKPGVGCLVGIVDFLGFCPREIVGVWRGTGIVIRVPGDVTVGSGPAGGKAVMKIAGFGCVNGGRGGKHNEPQKDRKNTIHRGCSFSVVRHIARWQLEANGRDLRRLRCWTHKTSRTVPDSSHGRQ